MPNVTPIGNAPTDALYTLAIQRPKSEVWVAAPQEDDVLVLIELLGKLGNPDQIQTRESVSAMIDSKLADRVISATRRVEVVGSVLAVVGVILGLIQVWEGWKVRRRVRGGARPRAAGRAGRRDRRDGGAAGRDRARDREPRAPGGEARRRSRRARGRPRRAAGRAGGARSPAPRGPATAPPRGRGAPTRGRRGERRWLAGRPFPWA